MEIFVEIVVKGRPLRPLVDTGATHLVLSAAAAALIGITLSRESTPLTGFAGKTVKTPGTVAARVQYKNATLDLENIPVLPLLVHGAQAILGMDFLSKGEFTICCVTGALLKTYPRIAAAANIPCLEGTP